MGKDRLSRRGEHIYLVDETGAIGEKNLWGGDRQKFYIHGAVRLPAGLEGYALAAGDRCQRDLDLPTVHMSALKFDGRERVVDWVGRFLRPLPWKFHSTVIERSFYPAALLTDLFFENITMRASGLPLKDHDPVYRAAIDLAANQAFGKRLLETFWNGLADKDSSAIELVVRRILEVAGTRISDSIWAEYLHSQISTFIHEPHLFEILPESVRFKHQVVAIRSRAFLDLLAGISPHSIPKRILHDRRNQRDPLDQYLASPNAVSDTAVTILDRVEYTTNKNDTFLADVLCWVAKEHHNLKTDPEGSNPNARVVSSFLRRVTNERPPPVSSRGISEDHSNRILDMNRPKLQANEALSALTREYREIKEGRIKDPFFVDLP